MINIIEHTLNYAIVLCGYMGIRSHVKSEAQKMRQHVTKALADHRALMKLNADIPYGKGTNNV